MAETRNRLFEFTIRAKRTAADGTQQGALVPCYAADPDMQAAIKKAVSRLADMGFAFEDLEGKVRELDVAIWPDYVAKVWPDFDDALPPPAAVPIIVEGGGVFFGPISGFTA